MKTRPLCGRRIRNGSRPLDGRVDLQGHRGARGKRPENTLPAFEYCIESQMTTIELDTNVTADKQLMVVHDTVVNGRICLLENGRPAAAIPVRELTAAQLKRLDCGAVADVDFPEQVPVPGTRLVTLAEVFEFVAAYERAHVRPDQMRFNIEAKFRKDCTRPEIEEAARLMVETIEAAGMDRRSTVQSFVAAVLPEVRRRNRRIQTSLLVEAAGQPPFFSKQGLCGGRGRVIAQAVALGVDILSPDYRWIDELFVRRCHENRLKVLAWVVNDEKTMQRLLTYGVDGIISDYPDRLSRVHAIWCKENA